MDEGTKISDHFSTLNNIVSELESIEVKIDDEDKALRLILSLPASYVHLKPVLMYGKESLSFEEVATKIISEERRMKSDENTSSRSMLLTRSGACNALFIYLIILVEFRVFYMIYVDKCHVVVY